MGSVPNPSGINTHSTQSVSDIHRGRASVKEAKAEKNVAHGQTGSEEGRETRIASEFYDCVF